MTDIIKNWIKDRLGIVLDTKVENFGATVRDGKILADILYSYEVLNYDNYITVTPTSDPEKAFKNLDYLTTWVQPLGVDCSEYVLYEISRCKSSTARKLFYELYLALQDKDKLYFITRQRVKEKLRPSDNRFEVSRVPETIKDPSISRPNPLSAPLQKNESIIRWHKDRYEVLLEQCRESREQYQRYLKEKFESNLNKIAIVDEIPFDEPSEIANLNSTFEMPKSASYLGLVEEEQKIKDAKPFIPDPKIGAKIVRKIKKKRKALNADNKLRIEMETMLVTELWHKMLSTQEEDFEEQISKKMLKQSSYEKQIMTKLLDVRQQRDNIIDNRRRADAEQVKRREEEFVEDVFEKVKWRNDEREAYYIEKDRILELHSRLYAEKVRLKKERNRKMCREIVKDIVDISLKHAEFRDEYGEYPPEHVEDQLGRLFVKHQSIFDVLEQSDEVILGYETFAEEMEHSYCTELERQNQMDQSEFENYCNFEWPWLMPKSQINLLEDDLVAMDLGMTVLGHIVHRFLKTKYPEPTLPPPPNLPKVDVAVCINGISDTTFLPVLQKLLTSRRVKVIEIQDTVNYCLKKYKDEINPELVDIALAEETEIALQELKRKKEKGERVEKPKVNKGAKKKGASKSTIRESISNDDIVAFKDKQNQTPRRFPGVEIVLSPAAELGRLASEILDLGDQLNDHITVAMFLEYLKTCKDMKGWALINFPTNLEQAALLEEGLTSIPVPSVLKTAETTTSIDELAEVESRNAKTLNKDQNSENRKSRLLINPSEPCKDPHYNTYLTAFIKIDYMDDDGGTKRDRKDSDVELILSPKSALEEFYADQGCNYGMSCKLFDFAAIKHLAKLIIGDFSLPPKSSVELFGDTVLYVAANLAEGKVIPFKDSKPSKDSKQTDMSKTKVKKSEKQIVNNDEEKLPETKVSSNTKKKGKRASKDAVRMEDKECQIPEIEMEEELSETGDSMLESEPEPVPKPGEYEWEYTNLPISDSFEIALATLWENCEAVYINDFKQLLFMRRSCINAVIPYNISVSKHMDIFIDRPDSKQNYLNKFQTMYNEIDADLRDDEELKAEIHSRIFEFREKLCNICVRRMQDSESERKFLVKEHWITLQVCQLANIFISILQLEMDRCIDTLQLICDYGTAAITKMPSDDAPHQKVQLPKIETKNPGEENLLMEQLQKTIENILILQDYETSENPLMTEMSTVHKICIDTLDKWNTMTKKSYLKMENVLYPKVTTKSKSVEKAVGAKGKKADPKVPKVIEPDLTVKEASSKILEEWSCALNGEIARVKLRLAVITEVAKTEIEEIIKCTEAKFSKIYDQISTRYQRELESVNAACDVLARALENETPLQAELVLDGGNFYVRPDIVLFPDTLPPEPPPLNDPDPEFTFTINQLSLLTDILLDLAPDGIMPERCFVYLIQDLIVHNAEDEKEPMVPMIWTKLRPPQVTEICHKVYGNSEYVDWKDFIIYNLCLDFPSEEALLSTLRKFRDFDPDLTETVKDYQFYQIHFWFQDDFDPTDLKDMFRFETIRKFLFKLFCINWDTVNYTALLLYFCKDVDPIVGFAKALALSLGKCVCWSYDIGESFVDNVIRQRQVDAKAALEKQKLHEEAEARAVSLLDKITDDTVHLCESVVIEEYFEVIAKKIAEAKNSEDGTLEEDSSENSRDSIEISSEEDEEVAIPEHTEILEEPFSNVAIGFEVNPNAPKIYFLPFEVLITVMTTALPWHTQVQNVHGRSFRQRLQDIFLSLRRSEFNNAVLVHQFLNHKDFKDLLRQVIKFEVVDVRKAVIKLVLET